MTIESVARTQYAHQSAKAGASTAYAGSSSFAAILSAKTAQSDPVDPVTSQDGRRVDFTGMTRQELFDWMNEQLRTGKMTFEESTPFLAMTVRISESTGQAVDMATDDTRYNFMEKARSGLEGALWRNDKEQAERLERAIAIMNSYTGRGVA